jgi:hypothetical protein
MGMVKQDTQLIPVQKIFRVGKAHPTWEMHPDWIQALRNLDTYNQWVCEIVMPIVFQWIEEHKAEVYENIPIELRDDMGVVIENAFQMVKNGDLYKRGLRKAEAYEEEVQKQKIDTKKINPLWQNMSQALDEARENARKKFTEMLPNSIRPAP